MAPSASRLQQLLLTLSICSAFCCALQAAAISVAPPNHALAISTKVELLPSKGWQILDSTSEGFLRETTLKQGDTPNEVLARLGAANDYAQLAQSVRKGAQQLLHVLPVGGRIVAHLSDNGALLQLSGPNAHGDKVIRLIPEGEKLSKEEQTLELIPRLVIGSATVETTLFAATDSAGLPETIAASLPDVFGGRIDFLHRLKKGDRFSVIYEMLCHEGAAIKTGKIIAAEIINAGARYSAYWLDGDHAGYYDEEGHSLARTFLSSPLEYTRITSGYVQREHPILKRWIHHNGIDFSAPIGTPVKATAAGTVEFIGEMRGFGNFIVLKHGGIYSTAYGHLNGFADGLRRGSVVNKGQIIGYVGQTGWATGPHLHYEFRINGIHHDPETAPMPDTQILTASQLSALHQRIETLRIALGSGARTQLAAAD